MILKAIQISKRRLPFRVIAAQPLALRVKVPLQGHRSQGQLRRLPFPVQVAPRIQHPILLIHQPLDLVGGSPTPRMLLGFYLSRTLLPALADHLLDCARQLFTGPLAYSPQPLRELPSGRRLVAIPDSIKHLLSQRSATSRFDLQHPVQKTQYQSQGGKQALPGQPRRSKPVCPNSLWRVLGIELLGLLFELAVCSLKLLRRSVAGQPGAEKTPLCNGGRQLDFLAVFV